MARTWTIRSPSAEAGPLGRTLGVPPLVAQVLAGRGLTEPDEARAFLYPDLSGLHSPSADPAFGVAAGRLLEAARAREPIVIYGDYDVDGITGSAILWHALRLADANVRVYIPHRLEEGYGLNLDAIEQLAAEGARVLVTVDCGITSRAEVERANELGVDVLVTDHHEADPGRLPPALALVDPKLPESPYPFRELSGAGVALKLAWAIGQGLSPTDRVSDPFRHFLVSATGLAAVGTVADVVPLVGENHVLAAFGLDALAGSRNPGVRALLDVTGLAGRRLNAGHVAFMIGPRLNAAGRVGEADGDACNARSAVELLTTAGPEAARTIAEQLDRQNRERQAIERKIFEDVERRVADEVDLDREAAIVLASEAWHRGVIGIVASKLVEKYWRPTILIATGDGEGRGSGRSIPGLHLFEALSGCSTHLTRFGGHAMAAGIRLAEADVDAFREAFLACAAERLTADDLVPRVTVDAEATPADLSLEAAEMLERMGPFGAGNRRPVFAARQVRLVGPARRMGQRGDHLQVHVTEGGRSLRAVGWGMGEMAEALSRAGACGIAFTCGISEFRGPREIELNLKDVWVRAYGDESAAKEFA